MILTNQATYIMTKIMAIKECHQQESHHAISPAI